MIMNETTKLRITTVTPVTIGSGVELSPYADYITDNEQICFIDKKKMVEKIMQKGESYLDQYVYGVANKMDNNRSEFDLKSYLLNNEIVKSIDDVISSRCPLTGNFNNKLPVKGIVKSPLAKPYFPGSSIKGALKTVLMYNWLKTNENAEKTIKKVINDGNFDWLEKLFEYKEDEITKNVVRENVIQQVTDSKMMSRNSNVAVDCYRAGIPLRFECIAKEQTTEFELTLANYKWEDLVEQANDYAFDCLDHELHLISKQINQLSEEKDKCNEEDSVIKIEKFIVKLNNYRKQVSVIQDLIDNESMNAYFRIGFGKGYYLNSLGIAIYDYVSQKGKEDLYKIFVKFLKEEVAKGTKGEFSLENFPKTRLFVTKTQEPLGWIKIEKIN